ncbi:MAG: hypothetical protein EON91_06065 [Brevundimonas sp.]|nr:MAG: hypothetical protein EON91_06065 [Brevundimonas sp.]
MKAFPRRVTLLCGLALTSIAGCEQRAEDSGLVAPHVREAPAPASVGRAELLSALDEAASAHAIGRAPSNGLTGRTLNVRLPFSCFGPDALGSVAPEGLARAVWSDATSLTLTLIPADWMNAPLVGQAADQWEAVEGLWIDRPWLRDNACPVLRVSVPVVAPHKAASDTLADEVVPPPPAQPVPQPAPQSAPLAYSAGLAVLRETGASRLGRRPGQAYRFTVRGQGEKAAAPAPGGYRLALEGRFDSFPDGRVIHCIGDDPDRRPVCVAAVRLDVVAFETVSGERLSEWRPTGG